MRSRAGRKSAAAPSADVLHEGGNPPDRGRDEADEPALAGAGNPQDGARDLRHDARAVHAAAQNHDPDNGEHRIAGQSCQGLVCLDQAEPGQSQHDAQRHHVHAQPLFDEEEDGDAEDDKGEDDLGGHGAPEMCRWFFVSVLL
jgi:hypothetical protein